MSILLAPNFVFDTSPLATFHPDNPVIGWQNIIAPSQYFVTSAQVNFPASNMGSPSTYLKWKSAITTTPQSILLSGLPANEVNYVAIAGHNWGSAALTFNITALDISLSPPIHVLIMPNTTVPNDAPIIFRFTEGDFTAFRINFEGTLSAPPEAAVIYIGRILVLERKVWIEHTPITYGRLAKIANGRSESGNFLGRIVLNERNESSVNVQHISPTFYRTDIDPFIAASKEVPFFFAWRPARYPNETGYAWMMNEPRVTHASPHGLMQLQLDMQGLA
jgi:hypothetical protein